MVPTGKNTISCQDPHPKLVYGKKYRKRLIISGLYWIELTATNSGLHEGQQLNSLQQFNSPSTFLIMRSVYSSKLIKTTANSGNKINLI
jgi:hypothetical protein